MKTGKMIEVLSDMSGDEEKCYKYIDQYIYTENDEGDPLTNNAGFEDQALDKEIFGYEAALQSLKKFKDRK